MMDYMLTARALYNATGMNAFSLRGRKMSHKQLAAICTKYGVPIVYRETVRKEEYTVMVVTKDENGNLIYN